MTWAKFLKLILLFMAVAVICFLYRLNVAKTNIAVDAQAAALFNNSNSERRGGVSQQQFRLEKLSNAGNAPRAFANSVLPAPNIPLTSIIDDLLKRSDAGDFRASCRLAAELTRCSLLQQQIQSVKKIQSKLLGAAVDEIEHDRLKRALDHMTIKKDASETVCNGFENTQNLEPWRYLFRAALGGHVPSMAEFVMVPPWSPTDFVGNLDAWAAYHEYGNMFLTSAANLGDKGAVWYLAELYAGNKMFPFESYKIVDTDPFLAAKYAYASFAHPGEKSEVNTRNRLLSQLQSKLSMADMLAAKQQGEALASSWPSSTFDYSKRDRKSTAGRAADEICEY